MSTFGPIVYEDMALLNAQWQQARPPMAGLGASYGQHEYRDLSYLNARLRPILPATVGMPPGAGSLSGNSLGVTTIEETTITGEPFTREQLMQMQDQLNGALATHGYQQLKVDGKLGPATCGAIEWYQQNVNPQGGTSFEVGCGDFTPIPPKKLGSGAPSAPPSRAPAAPAQASMFGTGGGTNWMLWGGAVAAIAVGASLVYRASKKR